MFKKRIAFIVDSEAWAFDIEAHILKEHLKDSYDCDIFVAANYQDDLFSILEDTKEYDIIHFFWRKLLLQFDEEDFQKKCNYIDSVCSKISTGIYDHLFLEEENISLYQNVFQKYCKKYYTCSKKLEDIYKAIDCYPNPWGTIHDTYDDSLYDGGDRNRFKSRRRESFVVGWVGNSNWNIKYKDFKGCHSILNPVLDELIEKDYAIEKFFADKNIRFRTNEEMPEYYQNLDVCIITSYEEGTPRPVIEAMASGVPLISTDVGIVEEAFGPKQKEFIIGDRKKEDDSVIAQRLKEKIITLYNHRELLEELSEENYLYGQKNDIHHLISSYKEYFDSF